MFYTRTIDRWFVYDYLIYGGGGRIRYESKKWIDF